MEARQLASFTSANLYFSSTLIVILAPIFAYLLLDKISSLLAAPTASTSPSCFIRSVLSTRARLASLTYSNRRVIDVAPNFEAVVPDPLPTCVAEVEKGQLRVTPRRRGRPSDYTVIDAYASNSVWLLKPAEADPKWIVAFRGTAVVDDLVTDTCLILSVAANKDCGLGRVLDRTARLLTDHVFVVNEVARADTILLLGHSLGATLAEAMLLYLRSEGYTAVTACGFDSPGLPRWYRDLYPGLRPASSNHSEDLTLVYAPDNFINNLAPAPCGAMCYRVAKNDPLDYNKVLPFIGEIVNGFSKVTLIMGMVMGMVNQHRDLENMATLLDDGYFHHDVATAGRHIVGQALRMFWKAGGVFFDPIRSILYPLPAEQPFQRAPRLNRPPLPMHVPTGPTEFDEFPEVDDVVALFNRSRGENDNPPIPEPYVVRNVPAFVQKLQKGRDIVCPFVGVTSAGKTSLLKAIFNLSPDDNLLRVSATMNTTKDNIVMLWRVLGRGDEMLRLWLMDMPGVLGADTRIIRLRSNGFLANQLDQLRNVVQSACFVTKSNPDDEAKRMFTEVCEALKDRVFIVNNPHHSVHNSEEREALLKEAQDAYKEILREVVPKSTQDLKIVLTKVIRGNGATADHMREEEGIDDLRAELLGWLRARQDEIRKAAEEADSTYSCGTCIVM